MIESTLTKAELNQTNMVGQWKRVYLPIELLGSRGIETIFRMDKITVTSYHMWC